MGDGAGTIARACPQIKGAEKLTAKLSVIVGWALTRLALVLVPLSLLPYPSGDRVADDVTLYVQWSEVMASGHFPGGQKWQYPPLAGFVFWLGSVVPTQQPLGFILLALLADAAIFGVLLIRGLRANRLLAAWAWVIAGAAIGPVLLTRFDIFPTLLAVLALVASAKPVRAGVLLGVGALLKVWPILLVLAWPRRRLPPLVAAAAATVVGGMLLLATWGPDVLSFLTGQKNRGLQIESVGAAPFVLARMVGVDITTEYQFGCMEVTSAGTAVVSLIMSLIFVGTIAVIAFGRLAGRLETVPIADMALVIVLMSITTSRVFSPQFMVWVAGIAAVCLLNPATLMRPVIALLLPTAVLAQFVYPSLYGQLIAGQLPGAGLQLLRVALLVTATIWALVLVWRKSRRRNRPGEQVGQPASRPVPSPLRGHPVPASLPHSGAEPGIRQQSDEGIGDLRLRST